MTTPRAAGAAQGGKDLNTFELRGSGRAAQTQLAPRGSSTAAHAALSHIAVSNALLISGMFMPKLAFAAHFAAGLTGLTGLSARLGDTSVARSQDARS